MWLLHLLLRPFSNSQPPTTCSKTWIWILPLSSSSQRRPPNLHPSQWTSDKHHNNNSSTTVVVYLTTWTSQRVLSKASPSSSSIISKILKTVVSKITSCKHHNITLSSNSPLLKPTSLNNQIGQLMFQCLLRNRMCGLRALTCSIWVIWRLVISKSWKVWTPNRHLGDPLPCKGHPCMGHSLNSKIIKLRHPLSLFPCQTSVLLSTATLNNLVSLNNNNSLSSNSASNLSCNNSNSSNNNNSSSLLIITRVGSISSNSLDSVLSNHHSSETTTDKVLHSWND